MILEGFPWLGRKFGSRRTSVCNKLDLWFEGKWKGEGESICLCLIMSLQACIIMTIVEQLHVYSVQQNIKACAFWCQVTVSLDMEDMTLMIDRKSVV